MFCEYCGKKISDDSIFCEYCGKRVSSDEAVMYSTEPQMYNMNAQLMPGNMQGAPMGRQMPGNINGRYEPEVYMPGVRLYMNNVNDDFMNGLYKPGGYVSNGVNGQYAMGIGWIIDPLQIPDMNRPYVPGEVFVVAKTVSEAAQIAITRSDSWMEVGESLYDSMPEEYIEDFNTEKLIKWAGKIDKENRKHIDDYLWIVSQEGAIAELERFDDSYIGADMDVFWYVITPKRKQKYLPTRQSTIIVQCP